MSSSHEARAAQNAQTIVDDGCWGMPRLFDGQQEWQKPPMYYWLVALIAMLRSGQVDAWAVRFPAAICALGCVLFMLCWAHVRRKYWTGVVATFCLATFVHFTSAARVGRIDMVLTFTICWTLGGYHFGNVAAASMKLRAARLWWALCYLMMGFGLLLKGPIGFVLPILVMIVDGIARRPSIEKENPITFCQTWRWGATIVVLIAAPWYWWAHVATNGEFFMRFFWLHNVQRGLGGSATLETHVWWFYLLRINVDLLPWIIILPFLIWWIIRSRQFRFNEDVRFGVIWFIAMFAFLSAMRFKRADYLLPAYPGIAWCIGSFFAAAMEKCTAPIKVRLAYSAMGMVAICTVTGWFVYASSVTVAENSKHPYQELAHQIRKRTKVPVIFFRTEVHELAFHVGRPLDTIMEWENLDIWATQADPVYIVMPPECARQWRTHLKKGKLVEFMRSTDMAPDSTDRPVVVMRSVVGKSGHCSANQLE